MVWTTLLMLLTWFFVMQVPLTSIWGWILPKKEGTIEDYRSKEEEFSLGGLNMDGPITRSRNKRFQEEFGGRLNSLMEEREEEVKLIYFSQLLE